MPKSVLASAARVRAPSALLLLLLLLLLLSLAVASGTAAAHAPGATARPRCSPSPTAAASFVIPPAPFAARLLAVRRLRLPPGEPTGGGPRFKRLYLVSFRVLKGNAVLPAGHRYAQFAYVARRSPTGRWCFLKGGSGP